MPGGKSIIFYTPYGGLNKANQKGLRFGVFGRKVEGTHSFFLLFRINIRVNETKMFRLCLFHWYEISRN